MGQKSAKIYHQQQKCEFYSKQHKKRQFTSGVSQDIGGRPYQEDRYIMIDDLQSSQSQYVTIPSALYVVLDGHGGYQCAEYVKANFVNIFVQTDAFQSMDYPAAFRSTYKELETTWNEQASLYKMEGWSSGTCVLACLVVSEGIYVSWVGDCRMTGYSDLDMKHVQRITVDQKPTAPKELSRILKAGAKVKHIKIPGGCFRNSKGPDRVYPGGLAVARSIGTIKCKQSKYGAVDGAVVGYPEVRYINVDEFQGVRWLVILFMLNSFFSFFLFFFEIIRNYYISFKLNPNSVSLTYFSDLFF